MIASAEPLFSDEKFMSAAEKKKVLTAWLRFLKNGCKLEQFTQALYHHLIQHCSFIAHFDRRGFYNYYFQLITDDVFRFMDQFDPAMPGISAELGDNFWLSSRQTGADLSRAMRESAGPYINRLRQHFSETHRQAEIGAAKNLLSKHGLAVTTAAPVPDPIRLVPKKERRPPRQESLFVDGSRPMSVSEDAESL